MAHYDGEGGICPIMIHNNDRGQGKKYLNIITKVKQKHKKRRKPGKIYNSSNL